MSPSRLVLAAAAAVLAACGDSDESGPATEPRLDGTILGQPFTPAESAAIVLDAAACSIGESDVSATGLAIGFGDFTGLCALVTGSGGCGVKANATIVTAVVVRARLGGTAAPIGPGTYAVTTSPLPDTQGNVSFAQAAVARTDAACGDSSGNPVATSGTVRIDAVDASRVVGFADLTFEANGGRVSGAFSAARCGFRTDVCSVLSGGDCTGEVCVP